MYETDARIARYCFARLKNLFWSFENAKRFQNSKNQFLGSRRERFNSDFSWGFHEKSIYNITHLFYFLPVSCIIVA